MPSEGSRLQCPIRNIRLCLSRATWAAKPARQQKRRHRKGAPGRPPPVPALASNPVRVICRECHASCAHRCPGQKKGPERKLCSPGLAQQGTAIELSFNAAALGMRSQRMDRERIRRCVEMKLAVPKRYCMALRPLFNSSAVLLATYNLGRRIALGGVPRIHHQLGLVNDLRIVVAGVVGHDQHAVVG